MPSEFNDVFDSNLAVVKVNGILQRPLRETLGIFCQHDAESRGPPDVEVHYAKQHTGFVIGFGHGCRYL